MAKGKCSTATAGSSCTRSLLVPNPITSPTTTIQTPLARVLQKCIHMKKSTVLVYSHADVGQTYGSYRGRGRQRVPHEYYPKPDTLKQKTTKTRGNKYRSLGLVIEFQSIMSSVTCRSIVNRYTPSSPAMSRRPATQFNATTAHCTTTEIYLHIPQ